MLRSLHGTYHAEPYRGSLGGAAEHFRGGGGDHFRGSGGLHHQGPGSRGARGSTGSSPASTSPSPPHCSPTPPQQQVGDEIKQNFHCRGTKLNEAFSMYFILQGHRPRESLDLRWLFFDNAPWLRCHICGEGRPGQVWPSFITSREQTLNRGILNSLLHPHVKKYE